MALKDLKGKKWVSVLIDQSDCEYLAAVAGLDGRGWRRQSPAQIRRWNQLQTIKLFSVWWKFFAADSRSLAVKRWDIAEGLVGEMAVLEVVANTCSSLILHQGTTSVPLICYGDGTYAMVLPISCGDQYFNRMHPIFALFPRALLVSGIESRVVPMLTVLAKENAPPCSRNSDDDCSNHWTLHSLHTRDEGDKFVVSSFFAALM